MKVAILAAVLSTAAALDFTSVLAGVLPSLEQALIDDVKAAKCYEDDFGGHANLLACGVDAGIEGLIGIIDDQKASLTSLATALGLDIDIDGLEQFLKDSKADVDGGECDEGDCEQTADCISKNLKAATTEAGSDILTSAGNIFITTLVEPMVACCEEEGEAAEECVEGKIGGIDASDLAEE